MLLICWQEELPVPGQLLQSHRCRGCGQETKMEDRIVWGWRIKDRGALKTVSVYNSDTWWKLIHPSIHEVREWRFITTEAEDQRSAPGQNHNPYFNIWWVRFPLDLFLSLCSSILFSFWSEDINCLLFWGILMGCFRLCGLFSKEIYYWDIPTVALLPVLLQLIGLWSQTQTIRRQGTVGLLWGYGEWLQRWRWEAGWSDVFDTGEKQKEARGKHK